MLVIRQVDTPCYASFLCEKCSQSDEIRLRSFVVTAAIGHRGRVADRLDERTVSTVSHRARIATAALCAVVLGELRVDATSECRPRRPRSRARTKSTPRSGASTALVARSTHPGRPGRRECASGGAGGPGRAGFGGVQRRPAGLARRQGRSEGGHCSARRGDSERQGRSRRSRRLCRRPRHHRARR